MTEKQQKIEEKRKKRYELVYLKSGEKKDYQGKLMIHSCSSTKCSFA